MFAESGVFFEKIGTLVGAMTERCKIQLLSPHLFVMKNWSDYFAEADLLRLVCRLRARLAAQRDRDQRLWKDIEPSRDALEDARLTDEERGVVFKCLPSRRKWIRIGTRERNRIGEDRLLETTVFRTALNALREQVGDPPSWQRALREIFAEVDCLRQSETITFAPPRVHLVPKGDGSERRCLASYEHLADRLLLSRAAVYLREIFDPLMDEYSFAFRQDSNYSYKAAIDELVRYRRRYANQRLYVAECDIQSFFDVINHQVVEVAYDGFVQQLDESKRPDPQLRKILQAYLRSFTSRGNLRDSTDPKVVAFRHLVKPLEKTDVGRFYPNQNLKDVPLGIPQGGALSPLIANLVLHSADRAVRAEDDPELLYLRFCDDIIIVHPDRTKCRAALDRYMQALELLKLPAHPLPRQKKTVYGAAYFDAKTKGPFPWTAPSAKLKSGIPWVAFLGVHVRHDGAVRVRQSSLEKHEGSLKKELKRYEKMLGKGGCNLRDVSEESRIRMLKSFEAHIVAMGVGYATERNAKVGRLCWASAFPALTCDGPAGKQLKRLDSTRGQVVAKMKKFLGLPVGPLRSHGQGYYGRPYSYYGRLMDVERHSSYPPWTSLEAYSYW